MLGSFLAAVMLCWLGWERFDPQRVIVWMTLLGLSTGVRTAMFFAYLRAPANQRTAERWEWRYWVTLMLSAAIWGWGAFAVMPTDDALGQTLIMLFAVGMSVSAVSMGLVLLPSTGWLLLQPSTLQQGIALAVLVFAWFVVSATQSLSSALTTAWRLKHEMQRAHRLAMVASCTDELTGLNNRRAFFDNASAQHVQCRDAGTFMAVLMLDVDHFKQINDTFGHAAGDQVLQRIGAAISASLRDNDIAGRLGGEEFAILLPNTPPDTAIEVAERLRALIAKLRVNDEHPVTASIGLAFAKAPATELGALLSSADSAMYLSKVSGRNRVTVAEPEQETLHKQH
ncbi:GGDEF domain-containing protein [Pseudomonas putida]|uniref:GGDEF domain-containing protein n=1 Tax=Pseudomonas putida TaxID=303 RepID=UPI002118D778